MSESRLVCSPATADSVISVGAYSTKNSWTAVGGMPVQEPTAEVNNLAYFSSPGPRRDGRQAPDIAAPGYEIASTMSGQTSSLPLSYQLPDGKHRIGLRQGFGTSLAAAHVAGVVALFFQKTPGTPIGGLRLKLQQNARQDSFTGTAPNYNWGWGKLDAALPSAVDVLPLDLDGGARLRVQPSPSRAETSFDFNLPVGSSAPDAVLKILDLRGRVVATLKARGEGGPARLVWNGLDSAGAQSPAGLYLARLEAGAITAGCKFVRLR
jgi:subtilisin family serine protease